jgi:predicted DNA-binding transcriptional regulator YafY
VAEVAKFERIFNLLSELYATRVPLTIEELRDRVAGYGGFDNDESFRRTFERDKGDLRGMGIEVALRPVPFGEPGQEGYIVDERDQLLPELDLTTDERAAVQVALSSVRVGGEDALAALRILGGRDGNDTAGAVAAYLPESQHLGTLIGAAAQRRKATFHYADLERTVHPWRLACVEGRWYLGGFDELRSAHRTFRLDRIEGQVVTGEPGAFEPPEELPALRLEPWQIGSGEPVAATVVVDAGHGGRARAAFGKDVVWESLPGGALRGTINVTNSEAFRTAFLEFGDHAELVGPPLLRADLLTWLHDTVGALS